MSKLEVDAAAEDHIRFQFLSQEQKAEAAVDTGSARLEKQNKF